LPRLLFDGAAYARVAFDALSFYADAAAHADTPDMMPRA